MGGYWYCFHWLLRLRGALFQTINCPEWKTITTKSLSRAVKTFIEELCSNKSFFQALKMFVASTFPVVKLLQLLGQNEAGMDKLYFATQMCINVLGRNAHLMSEALQEIAQDPAFKENKHSNQRCQCEHRI